MDEAAFTEFFCKCYGFIPFPWQTKLAQRVLAGEGWPDVVALPTAAGKTAVLDIAVLALANAALGGCPAPRRILYVVDRRIVVDTVYTRACRLASVLATATQGEAPESAVSIARALRTLAGPEAVKPLEVVRLRGGGLLEREWVASPAQPTVVISTVDQLGSRLLFRGYGHGRGDTNDLSVQAGLAGCDAILFLDEAHLSHAFLESARAVSDLRTWQEISVGGPWTVVALTATPREAQKVFPEPGLLDDDKLRSALGRRLSARKCTVLREVPNDSALPEVMAGAAEELVAESSTRVVAVVANRVLRARAVFEQLRQKGHQAILLTGRARPLDRDLIVAKWLDRIRAGRQRDPVGPPLFVVATQTIEVGADLDFDGMVTEVAALDALRQRLGRLDRLGELGKSRVVIVASKEQLARNAEDPIYGRALRETWRFLKAGVAARAKRTRHDAQNGGLDLGWDGLETLLGSATDPTTLISPSTHAPTLLPSQLDLLAQTSPLPMPDPEVAAFLHGLGAAPADVRMVWRADLDPDRSDGWAEIVSLCPPRASEALELPVWSVRRWLAEATDADATDVEGERADSEEVNSGRCCLRWTRPNEAKPVGPGEIRPGDMLVVPAAYGGCDAYGWDPSSRKPVSDLAEQAAGHDVLRIHPRTLQAWLPEDERKTASRNLEALRIAWQADDETRAETARLLQTLAASAEVESIREVAAVLQTGLRRLHLIPYPEGDGFVVLGPLQITSSDRTERSNRVGKRVSLQDHLRGVARRTGEFARTMGLPDSLTSDLELAARLHDLGKSDPRMQAWLYGGDTLAVDPGRLLAKSGMDPRDRATWRRARERARYPAGARHEALSVALIAGSPLIEQARDRDLVLHLIASHHGVARPFVPPIDDPEDLPVELEWDGYRLLASVRHGQERLDSGVGDRFWRLVARYGWWGLAYLEAILRLADWRQSEDEQAAVGSLSL